MTDDQNEKKTTDPQPAATEPKPDPRSPLDRAIAARNAPRTISPQANLRKSQGLIPPEQAADLTSYALPPVEECYAAKLAEPALDRYQDAWGLTREAALDPGVTDRDVAEKGRRAFEAAYTGLEKASAKIESHINGIEVRIDAAVEPNVHPDVAREIRDVMRDRSFQDKTEAACADPKVASALLKCPPVLSGLTASEADQLRNLARLALAPEDMKALKQAQRVRSIVENAAARGVSDVKPILAQLADSSSSRRLDALDAHLAG